MVPKNPGLPARSTCVRRPVSKPDLSTANLCNFSAYLSLPSHSLQTIERNSLAEILISFPVFFVDQIGHRYAFYCWVEKEKMRSRPERCGGWAKTYRTPGGIYLGMSPLVKRELGEGVCLVVRLSSLRTISFLAAPCVSHQHSWGPLALLTDSGCLNLHMALARPTGALGMFPVIVNRMVDFIVMLIGFGIV